MYENNEDMIEALKNRYGYSTEETNEFLTNPRNIDILNKSPDLFQKTFVIEVLESHGCVNQAKVGDKYYFTGAGNLITKLCPKHICIYALAGIEHLIYTAQELFYAGVDPNEMHFKRAGCIDIGLKCGGWGKVIMELKIVDRDSIKKS